VAAFCEIWQQTRTTMSVMNAITSGDGYNMSSPKSVLLPTMQALNNVFVRANQVAPAAVSADMANLASWWNQVVADFKYGNTVGQVHAYLKAHPPAGTATVTAAVHDLSNYLSTTCHINMSS
jgi:hypothetical protein